MTKRNLLLVSLFLVFAFGAMATSALASTQWVPGSFPNLNGRGEGLTEETGQYTLTNNVAGTVEYGDYFTVTYNVPAVDVVPNSQNIVCTGPDFPSHPSCAGVVVASLGTGSQGNVVTLKFVMSPWVVFATTGDEIALTVRINASNVGCKGPVTGTAVPFNVANNGQTVSLTTANPTALVLVINCEPTLSLTFGTQHGKSETEPAEVLTCIGVKEHAGDYGDDFTLNVDEEFPNALTSESYEMNSDPDPTVTTGTTVNIVFTNVPQGVGIAETDIKPCSTLWTGNPLYCAGGTLDIVLDGPATGTKTTDTGTPPTHSVTFTFMTTSEDQGSAESVDIKFDIWSHGPLPAGSPQMMANVYKGPVAPSTDIPRFTGVLEGTGGVPWNLSVVEFNDCKTVLLYTWLTDQYGWDAGVEVSNTTLDPGFLGQPLYGDPLWGGLPKKPGPGVGSPGSAVPQTGPCTWYVYGGGALVSTLTSPPIAPGSTFAWDFAGGIGPGVSAYSIAVCDFQNAHGYAILYYNFLGYDGVAADYLADVLPIPGLYHRSPAGDALGETAVAPYLINRWLEKLIGPH